ncbi:MAG: type IV pilus assembly protein PilM [Actinomycetota bacterium]|nr:type IV pilus assembly protein PilM [Actinomycetota bacterium]
MNWNRPITLRRGKGRNGADADERGDEFPQVWPFRADRAEIAPPPSEEVDAEPVATGVLARARNVKISRGRRQSDRSRTGAGVTTALARQARAHALTTSSVSLRRANQTVGLKVGASQIAAARVANSAFPQVLDAVREPLDPGVVVGGEVRDPDALGEALKSFFARHKLPARRVRLGIANNRIGVRTVEIAGIEDPKQLANAITFQAQEALPIPIEEAVVDHQILERSVDADGATTYRVLLAVAYRDLVERYVTACRLAGIRLVGIDLEAFALIRTFLPRLEPDETDVPAAFAVVAVGHDRTTLAVANGRICTFTRVLDWGGSALDRAIGRALEQPVPAEQLPEDKTLKEVLFTEEAHALGLSAQSIAAAQDAARRELQAFGSEIVSSLHFYENQPGSLPVGEIVLSGGAGALSGLAESVERQTGILTRVGDPLARARPRNGLEVPHPGSLAVAIGLGIEG